MIIIVVVYGETFQLMIVPGWKYSNIYLFHEVVLTITSKLILNDVEKFVVLKALKCRLSATIHARKCLDGLLTYFGMRKITCFLVNDLH